MLCATVVLSPPRSTPSPPLELTTLRFALDAEPRVLPAERMTTPAARLPAAAIPVALVPM